MPVFRVTGGLQDPPPTPQRSCRRSQSVDAHCCKNSRPPTVPRPSHPHSPAGQPVRCPAALGLLRWSPVTGRSLHRSVVPHLGLRRGSPSVPDPPSTHPKCDRCWIQTCKPGLYPQGKRRSCAKPPTKTNAKPPPVATSSRCCSFTTEPPKLRKYPGVICGSDEHTSMLVIGWLLLSIFVLGFVALCTFAVTRDAWQRLMDRRMKVGTLQSTAPFFWYSPKDPDPQTMTN